MQRIEHACNHSKTGQKNWTVHFVKHLFLKLVLNLIHYHRLFAVLLIPSFMTLKKAIFKSCLRYCS